MKRGILTVLIVFMVVSAGCKRTLKDEKAALKHLGEFSGAQLAMNCATGANFSQGLDDLEKSLFDKEISSRKAGANVNISPQGYVVRQFIIPSDWATMKEDFYEKSSQLNLDPACDQVQITFGLRKDADAKEIVKILGNPDSKQIGEMLQPKPPMSISDALTGDPYSHYEVEWYQYGRLNFGVSTYSQTKGKVFGFTLVCKGQHDLKPDKNVLPPY